MSQNPNCPDSHYSEYDPATGECFHLETVALVKAQQAPANMKTDGTPFFVGFSLVLVTAMLIVRFKK